MINKVAQFFVLFVVILVLVGFSVVLTDKPIAPPPPLGDENTSTEGGQKEALVVERSYTQDANTFSGSLMAAEPCSTLSASVDLSEEQPEKITLVFDTQSNASTCNTSTPRKDFIVVVPSSDTAQLEKIVFNGSSVAFLVRSQ